MERVCQKLKTLLDGQQQKVIYFDIIATDFEIFREFGPASRVEFLDAGVTDPPPIFLRRINIFGDIYWDFKPFGTIQISMANRLLFFKEQKAQTGSLYGHLREVVWVSEPEHLEIWANTLLSANIKEKTLTLNIEFNANEKFWPAAKYWNCHAIRTQVGSSRTASGIISKSKENSNS